MLFEFKSRATGSVVMTADVGKKVLPLIGKTPDPKGIITVDQMPGAIAALEAACKREIELAAAAKNKAKGVMKVRLSSSSEVFWNKNLWLVKHNFNVNLNMVLNRKGMRVCSNDPKELYIK